MDRFLLAAADADEVALREARLDQVEALEHVLACASALLLASRHREAAAIAARIADAREEAAALHRVLRLVENATDGLCR